MSLSATFKTNADMERKGVAIELPAHPNGDIPTIMLARAGRNNPDYQKIADRVNKPFRRAAQVGALPQVKQDELTRRIFAEGGVIGWKNMLKIDCTGNEADKDAGYVDYSIEMSEALLKNLPELYASLIELSTDRATYQDVVKEEDAKNSSKSSATTANKEK